MDTFHLFFYVADPENGQRTLITRIRDESALNERVRSFYKPDVRYVGQIHIDPSNPHWTEVVEAIESRGYFES